MLTPEQQFVTYYDKLRNELNATYLHYDIAKLLRDAKNSRREEFNEALTFFEWTMLSNYFTTIMSISRFLDRRGDSLHLDLLFNFVKNNLTLFSTEAFRNRLLYQGRDAKDCEHWVQLHEDITATTVDQDTEAIRNLPIDNLVKWRHKKLAHIDEAFVMDDINFSDDYPILIQDIDKILDTLHVILNRYRIAYDGTEWAIGTPPVKYQIEYILNAISSQRKLIK